MSAQPQRIVRTITSNAVKNGRLRNNVVEWRKQAGASPLAPSVDRKPKQSLRTHQAGLTWRQQNILFGAAVVVIGVVLVARYMGLV